MNQNSTTDTKKNPDQKNISDMKKEDDKDTQKGMEEVTKYSEKKVPTGATSSK